MVSLKLLILLPRVVIPLTYFVQIDHHLLLITLDIFCTNSIDHHLLLTAIPYQVYAK